MEHVEARPASDPPGSQGIPSWKFFAGLMVHLGVPAYLLLLVGTLIVYALEHGALDGVFSLLPRISLYFVLLYAAVTASGTAAAALVDRTRLSRRAITLDRDPARRSRRALSHAIGALGTMKDDPGIDSALHAIEDAAWHHDDGRYQQVARDLDRAADTYAAAYATARGEQQQEVARLASETLRHVAQTLDDLSQDTGRTAAQQAKTMAGYIASKYGDDLDTVR